MKLINNDAFKVLDTLETKIDLVLTDPPYEISKKNNFHTMKNANRKGIDFGEWDYNFSLDWVKKLDRITNKDASLIIFVGLKQISNYIQLLEENGFVYKDMISWIKKNPMPRNTNRRYVSDREYALWFTKKGAKWTFNKNENTAFYRPEFHSGLVSSKDRIHPTQKHVHLLEWLLKTHSNENDTVLDLFMGSGSTGIACQNTNRNFIGVEKEKEYFDKAKEWLFKNSYNENEEKIFFDFHKMKHLDEPYGLKNIEEAYESTSKNKGLLEVARRLADK